MIRPLTFLSLVAAAGAGLHLYGVKHDVSQLEKTLRETVKQTEAARERTAVLRAEWALLNEPERLRSAARNLPLEVMQTAQFIRPSEMERRLPAAVAFAGAPSLFAPPASERPGASIGVAVAAAAPSPPPVPAAASPAAARAASPSVASPAPAPVARLAQAAPQPTASVSIVPLPPAAAPAQVAAAQPRPAPAPERPAPQPAEAKTPARPAPAPAPAPQGAALRTPEAKATELRDLAPRAAPRLAAPVRPADTRLADREIDRGMNLPAPPQSSALLRTALHMRPNNPAAMPAPRASELPSGTGSMLGGVGRPVLAPPVPVASASAATLGTIR
ncbi:hypothetical protein ACFQX4_05410 [Roseomonas sp. GCM10028921]